jgi:D-methionine transport system ATP-binding protein
MIEINNLQKSFGDLEVLSDISLKVNDGEIYGLVGKSGAGKSTLLRCINGLESYSFGSLKVNETEVKDLDKKGMRIFRKNVAMIFQQFPMLSRKTVFENIAFPMKCWKYSKDDINSRVNELAQIVGLTDKLKQRPNTLSGGQKQRVAIARALSMNPDILLSDEATSALDPITTKSILQLLREINEKLGITIIVVTHQMKVVKEICEKVSLLANGKIVASGEVKELFLNRSEILQDFFGKEDIIMVPEGVTIQIMLLEDDDSKTILSRMSSELQTGYTICGGKMERYRDIHLGSLIINVEKRDFDKIEVFLDNSNVVWHIYK